MVLLLLPVTNGNCIVLYCSCLALQDLGAGIRQTAPMLCCSQNRDFCCFINRQQHDSEKLASLIIENFKGPVGGRHTAYFKAYVDQTAQQLVVVPALLSRQGW